MKLLKNILLGFLIIAVTGCVKDEVVRSVTLQDVSFGITLVEPGGLKNDPWDFDCPVDEDGNLLTPTVAHVEIKNAEGNIETFHPQVFYLNGRLYSQAIKLQPGTYEVTRFFLLTHVGGTIIMATPAEGGSYAQYVSNPVAFEFVVNAFQKSEVEVEVLCFIGNKSSEFGFFWFEITEIVIRQFCFFGNICANGGEQSVGKTGYGGNYEGNGSPWWYYFDVSGPATQTIYAGQQPTDATVTYQNGQIIIDMGSLAFQNVDEPVKIQGFDLVPASPVPLGVYQYKGNQLIWDVDPYPFYVIHLDVLVQLPASSNAPYGPSNFVNSPYENVPGGLQVDMPAIFEIHVFRTFNGQTLEMPNSPFSNLGKENQPLCVSYPDRIRIPGEEFSFELHILVPDGEGDFAYQLYHTFTSTDGGQLSTDPGNNNVVEFVLGNCNYSPTDLQLEW